MLNQCLESGWVTQGPLVAEFESRFAIRHSLEHALATTSCTAALHLAVIALGLEPGDEVIVPAFTWVTSAHCAEYAGAKVVFVDVDPATFNIDPAAVEDALTERTRAIIAVHLFGLSAPMDELREIASKRDLYIIEDAACAVGTTYRGAPVGALGDLGCFSFHPRKVITTGEGGMVTTSSDELAAIVGSLRNHGATGQPVASTEGFGPWTMATFDRLGFNLRLSDIQAAVGIAQMDKLDALLTDRRAIAEDYLEQLKPLEQLVLPVEPDYSSHTYQSFVIRIDGDRQTRNRVMAFLADRDIQTRPGTHAVHRLGYYRDKYSLVEQQFPAACLCEDTSVTLPIFPGMKQDDVSTVVGALKEALSA